MIKACDTLLSCRKKLPRTLKLRAWTCSFADRYQSGVGDDYRKIARRYRRRLSREARWSAKLHVS